MRTMVSAWLRIIGLRRLAVLAAGLLSIGSLHASISLQISANSTTRSASAVEADYSSTHLFVDEINGDSIPITVFFDPGTTGVDEADVFTNLTNGDLANQANGSG